jgi:alpha-glucosidase
VLKYARGIIDHGFPPGGLDESMIPGRGIMDCGSCKPGVSPPSNANWWKMLHAMGFKVMLWVCPRVPDQRISTYQKDFKCLPFWNEKTTQKITGNQQSKPLMVELGNGQSAVLDFSNPAAVKRVQTSTAPVNQCYGVDGFKFDGR